MRQSQVLAAHVARRNQGHELIHRCALLGNHHQAAGVFVKPMNNACPWQKARLRITPKQTIEQCSLPISWCRMHHQPRALVDDQQMRIFKNNIKRHILGLEGLTLRCWLKLNTQKLASLDACRHFADHLVVNGDTTALNQLLQVTPREFGN